MAKDPQKKQPKKESNSAFQKFQAMAEKIVRAPKQRPHNKPKS